MISNANINNLRVIKTIRSFREINNWIDDGYKVIVREHKRLPLLFRNVTIGEHKVTKKIEIFHEDALKHWFYQQLAEYKKLKKIRYYPYKFENPYGAYLIPPDIQLNEKVYVEDLIEDYVGGYCWVYHRLESCEALWNGEDLEILYDEYEEPELF